MSFASANETGQGPELEIGSAELSNYNGMHALVPMLLGLTAPCALLFMIDPAALRDIRIWIFLIMVVVLVVAGAIFVLSLLNPGTTVAATFNSATRRADFIRSGTFANTVYTVPFSRIVSVRLETVYDDDGYQSSVPVIVLTPHEEIELPRDLGAADVDSIRAMLGMR